MNLLRSNPFEHAFSVNTLSWTVTENLKTVPRTLGIWLEDNPRWDASLPQGNKKTKSLNYFSFLERYFQGHLFHKSLYWASIFMLHKSGFICKSNQHGIVHCRLAQNSCSFSLIQQCCECLTAVVYNIAKSGSGVLLQFAAAGIRLIFICSPIIY